MQDAEDTVIVAIATLASNEMSKDKSLTLANAFRKVINENLDFSESSDKGTSYQKLREFLAMKPGDALNYLIHLRRGEFPDMSFSEAFSEVQTEYPGIALEYAEELRR